MENHTQESQVRGFNEHEDDQGSKSVDKAKLDKKLEDFYDSYHLSSIQRFAVGKFLRDCIADKSNTKVDRIRTWFFEALNGRLCKAETQGQVGCPGIIPGLRGQPWW